MYSKIIFTLCLIFFTPFFSFAEDDTSSAKQTKCHISSSNSNDHLFILAGDHTVDAKEHRCFLAVFNGTTHVYGKVDVVMILGGNVIFHSGSEIRELVIILGGSFEQKDGVKTPEKGEEGYIRYDVGDDFFAFSIATITSLSYFFDKTDIFTYINIFVYIIYLPFIILGHFLFPRLLSNSKEYLCTRPILCVFFCLSAPALLIPSLFMFFFFSIWFFVEIPSLILFIVYLLFLTIIGAICIFLLPPLGIAITAKLFGDAILKWINKASMQSSILSIFIGMLVLIMLFQVLFFRVILIFLYLAAIFAVCVQLCLKLKRRFFQKSSLANI